MRYIAMLIALLAATPAAAQLAVVPTPVDTTALNAQITAAKASADAASAQAAALQAAIPLPSDAVPSADMATGGQVGSSPRYRRPDDQAPRISRTVSGVTTAAGTGLVTWPAMSAAPKLTVTPYVSSTETQVPTCYPVTGTVTTTGATIKCFKTQTLLGLGLVPFTVAPAGVQFDVLALPAS